jgi:hypothetical protein
VLKNRYVSFLALVILLFCIDKAQAKEIHPMPYLYMSEAASWLLNDEFVICDDWPLLEETVEQDTSDIPDFLFLTDDESDGDEEPLVNEKKCFTDRDDSE